MQGAKIIIAEQDPAIRYLLRTDLARAGHRVDQREVTSPEEANILADDLVSRTYQADVLLLGEVDDNPYDLRHVKRIVYALRAANVLGTEIALVRFSAKAHLPGWDTGATAALTKPDGLHEIPEVIAQLAPISGRPPHAQQA